MQLQKWLAKHWLVPAKTFFVFIHFIVALLIVSRFSSLPIENALAGAATSVVEDNTHESTFRVPAKLYGAAYSIKVSITRNDTEFEAPFWVRPDQTTSTLDLKQFAELGWYFKDIKIDELSISGQMFDIPKFKNEKSDLAFVPDFPKTCCAGVIGQDILKNYRVRFVPRPPAHLEFTLLPVHADQAIAKIAIKTKLLTKMKSLFSIDSDQQTIDGKKVDLSDVSYELNLSQNQFSFDSLVIPPLEMKRRRDEPIFKFAFLPPWRKIQILSISRDLQESARAVGLKPGMVIWSIQNTSAFFIDKFDVEHLLKGRRDSKISLVVAESSKEEEIEKRQKRRTIHFDFDTHSFSEISSSAVR